MVTAPLPRRACEQAREYLGVFRVVVLDGPRQSGKTTILRELTADRERRLVSFDDPVELAAATADPSGYLAALGTPLAIDEFQRGGDNLLLSLKYLVDRDDTKGQYLLAGSTNFLTTGQLSETLAGRVGIVRVWPFSQGERRQRTETFLERLLEDPEQVARRVEHLDRAELVRVIVTGGYPEAALAPSQRARDLFFQSYLETVISRESVLDAGSHRDSLTLRRVLDGLASRTAQEYNATDIAADVGLARETLARHLALLTTLHQTALLPGWASSAATRAKRRPKLVITDSGVAASLLGVSANQLADVRSREFGPLLETFVINELMRQAAWLDRCKLMHYRDRDGREVDVVLEAADGSLVGVEIKAATVLKSDVADHLRYVGTKAGDRWLGGIVLYPGDRAYRLDEQIWAVPLAALWS